MAQFKQYMWEILVPHSDNDNNKYPIEHHWAWDEYVKKISGGLTIHRVAIGQWISPEGSLFKDKMIPVRILCTEPEIENIIEFTIKHYNQEAVLAYEVSNNVKMRYKQESNWENLKDKIKYGILGPQIGDVPEK